MTKEQLKSTLIPLLLLYLNVYTHSPEIALAKQGKPSSVDFSEAYNTKIAAGGASWSCSSCAMFMIKTSWLTT